MHLNELLEVEDVLEVKGDTDRVVTGLAYDSRKVKEGDVFFAVPGVHVDGHEYAFEAAERGAAAVVGERRMTLPRDVAWIRVRSIRHAMGKWAALFFAYPSRRIVLVGVTGTNGKTTVTYLVESIFAAAGMAPGVIGTINYRYQGRQFPAPHTTPESIDLQAFLKEMVEARVRSAVMEVSSHALELERVRGIDFDGAVFTNLSRDHLDFHPDMDHYFSAKGKLFNDYLRASSKNRKFAVIHGGDPRGRKLLEKVRQLELEVLSFGQGSEWDIHPLGIKADLDGLRGKIRVQHQEIDFSSNLIGAANLENILGAVGVGFALGLPDRVIVEGIARLESVPGRLEKVKNDLGITVLVDYAHTPDALEKGLMALRELMSSAKIPKAEAQDPRLICAFGCGGDRDRGKRPLMGEIAGRLTDLAILTSDNPRSEDPLKILAEIEEGVKKTGIKKSQVSGLRPQTSKPETRKPKLETGKCYFVEPDRRDAIRLALRLARAGDMVLIAGKGHEDYQILGSKRIHFDDREVAREELAQLSCQP
jgi:UDP-N-acetylmuramoyl-L-alanyl-D-glutamate--2,6-diaminopimelate ligase